jgi:hypothetical protein
MFVIPENKDRRSLMQIIPEYDDYYVFSAVYHKGKQSSCGACPVIWEDQSALPGGKKPVLTWADGNYHLYDDYWFLEEDSPVVEDSIYLALNEAGETFGRIKLMNPECEIRWCLLEKEQMSIVMDIPD